MPYINAPSGGSGKISGVTVTGTAAASQVPVATSATAGAWAYPPGFEIGYDQITASVTVASQTEATGTTIITCAAHTFDGGPVIAQFFSPTVDIAATSGVFCAISLFEGATQISEFGTLEQPAAVALIAAPFAGFIRFTPTAAAHTYTVTAFKNNAATVHVNAGALGVAANPPCFVRFTKV